ncbi:MAG: hypothetical protein BRC32_01670 [Actinobacteria bacterium QS_8_72_14]|nr:MAG: hypothetical protein BRC32_01670 [Actinobacteria bacterium QS_8_72_14]
MRRAQQLGLHLDEIREILVLRETSQRPCDYVLDVANQRLAELDDRLAQIQRARDELQTLVARAQTLPADAGRYCALIEQHAGGDRG